MYSSSEGRLPVLNALNAEFERNLPSSEWQDWRKIDIDSSGAQEVSLRIWKLVCDRGAQIDRGGGHLGFKLVDLQKAQGKVSPSKFERFMNISHGPVRATRSV
ncbi:hypothetical protein A4X09_0g7777 [Tilletia walkeri]|uniref:Uncharacterized protein n=1 Tax=Tilletia walkeri TaxID=117179 RepID=A0A8X7N2H9_9BASI|nr:hypothetical protein A4X09_0g7777 [Tilletia walkeri]